MERERIDAALDVACRITDGEDVDWKSDDAQSRVVEQLRVVARVAEAFRRQSRDREQREPAGTLFIWGNLEARERLGEGGFGTVYRAFDRTLHREVALKLRKAGTDEAGRLRFLAEARRLASIRHPNVLTVYGADVHDERVGLWTELLEGKTLSAWVNELGTLGPAEVVAVGLDLCRALAAIHTIGLVHGDVKPSNVMREVGGRIVLMDFGAARELDRADDALLEATPVTAAPEILDGAAATPASDLYSLGVVLYYLLTGRYPVEASTLSELRAKLAGDGTVPLRDLRPELPAPLLEVVERSLASAPAERWPSAGAMERDLTRARSLLESGERSATAPLPGEASAEQETLSREQSSGAPESPPGRRGWRGLAIAVAVVTAVLAAATLWFWLRSSKPELEPAHYELVSTFPGDHRAPAISPDGSMVAFVSDASGSDQIWVKHLAQGEPIQVTFGEPPASHPSWSKRGAIVFARAGGGLWSVPPLGGEPRQLHPSGRGPDVSPDGARVVFQEGRGLAVLDLDGDAEPRQVEGLPAPLFAAIDMAPAFSSDGEWIAAFVQEDGPNGDLWITRSAGAEARRITEDHVEGGDPVFAPDGRSILAWSGRSGSRNLWRLPLDRGEPVPLTTGAGEDTDPTISPDGRTVVYTNVRNRWALVVLDLRTGERRQVLERGFMLALPVFSPDGREIAFFHTGKRVQISILDLETGAVRQLTTDASSHSIHPSWSPDGEWIYYYRVRPPSWRRIPARGGASELVVDGWRWETHMSAKIDPSGRYVGYQRQDPGYDSNYLRDLETGEERRLPDPHRHSLAWSPDGKLLAGHRHDGMLSVCSIEAWECHELTGGYRPRFSGDGSRLFFHRPAEEALMWELWSVGLEGSDERRIGTTGPHHPLSPTFSVSPDDRLVAAEFHEGRHELWRIDLR